MKGKTTLCVMSYNIRHGEGNDNVIDLERIAAVIDKAGADLVGLNEVDIKTARSSGIDQPGTLAKLLGMQVAYGANLVYQGGDYGNAILSRYPIVKSANTPLPAGGRYRWGLLHVEVDVHGRILHFLTTHLALTAEERRPQLERIKEYLQSLPGPLVVVGDFNIIAEKDEDLATFMLPLRDAWLYSLTRDGVDPAAKREQGYTFPSSKPDRRIDYIFISGRVDLAGTGAVFAVDSDASDHRALVARLVLLPI
ncbi:MAG TPA: metal-dependent hydrolase [Firmicutes bacterium]|nr:metal-dependent hydrolase [Bacillota bacterium]